MAEPKSKRTRRVSELQRPGETGYRVHLPDGTSKRFKTADEAQRWFDTTYPGDNYYMTRAGASQQPASQPTQPETPARQPHFASEDLPVYTPSGRTGIDRYIGANYSPRFNAASAKLGMNPLNWPKHIPASYWDSETHKNIVEGNNIAAGIVSAPFAAYAATEAAPLVWQGGKWLLNTAGRAMLPSEWATGAAQYFPRFAPQLQTAGQLGNATMAASLAGPGITNIAEGIKEGDTNQVLHGATDVAFSVPFLQEMRPLATLANGQRAFTPAFTATAPTTGTSQVVDRAMFSPTARTTATAAAIGTPVMAAASDAQQANPQGSWYENMWSTIKDNPAESAFAAWMLWKGGKGLRNRYLREPAGRPAKFTEPRPTRGEGELEEPYQPFKLREPMREDFMVTPDGIPEPSMPRPVEFAEPAPPKPTGLRPKKGKKAREWDQQNQAYSDWEARRDAHNQSQEEARQAWEAYDYQSAPTPYFDEALYNERHQNWVENHQRYDEEEIARYNREMEAYRAEQGRLDTEHQAATRDWEARKTANEQAVKAYEEGDPYKQWLARRQNWRNRGQWVKNNLVGLGLGGWVFGSHLFGGDGNTTAPVVGNPNGDAQTDSTQVATPDSVRVRNFISVTPDGRVVAPNVSGTGNDTIVPRTYQTQEFDD